MCEASIGVSSGVPDQPLNDDDEETLQGALNQARNARDVEPNALCWIGLEGRVDAKDDHGPVQSFCLDRWVGLPVDGVAVT